MRRSYAVVVVKEKGQFWAYIPELPGVYGRGKSSRGAKEDIAEALRLYIEDCRASGDPVPKSTARVVDVDTVSIAVGA